ncbi:hypothetical protein Tco_0554109 [Tanacetum coccineum]
MIESSGLSLTKCSSSIQTGQDLHSPQEGADRQGSQGKKTVDDSQETVDVSEESEPEPEPEPVKKKTTSRRVVKKKVTLSADDNIITDVPDIAFELGKSISLTKAEESEATRKVHATHARIVTESVKKKSGGRSSRDIMQALKESKKTSKRQPGTGTKPGVPDEEKDITKENVILEWGSEQESEYSEEDKLDDEEKDDKEGDADDEGDDHISDTQDTDGEDDETKLMKME